MPGRWLVDGMNVIGSRPDGWWRDREAAMRTFVARVEGFAAATGDEVAVVLDGRPIDLGRQGDALTVLFAPHADDVIAARTGQDDDPPTLTVVTSDRQLSARVRAHGAQVIGANAFRRRLER